MSDREREATRVEVEAELEKLRREAHHYSFDDIKSGDWFEFFIAYALKEYQTLVDSAYFKREYSEVPADTIAEQRIVEAQHRADIEGVATSSDYTWGLIATLSTDGGASPVTVQAGATAFLVDLMFTTQLQLRLAYDLALIYGFQPNLSELGDRWALIKVAFGIRQDTAMGRAVLQVAPSFLGLGPLDSSETREALAVVGKKLSQRSMIKMGIPGIGIPLALAVNHITTRYIGDHARENYRDKATIRDVASHVVQGGVDRLLMHSLWLVAHADGKVSQEKCWLIRDILADTPALLKEFEGLLNVPRKKTFAQISSLNTQEKALLFDAACKMAAVDHRIAKKEAQLLEEFARACDATLDPTRLDELARDLRRK